MALFHPGQMLVYGNVGVCQVEAVGTPKFLRGESREYYTLTPVYSKHKEKIYLPTGTAAYLRPPVTPQQGEAYLAEMPALEVRTSRYPKQARRLRAGLFISAQIARNARLCYNTPIYDYIPARGGTI